MGRSRGSPPYLAPDTVGLGSLARAVGFRRMLPFLRWFFRHSHGAMALSSAQRPRLPSRASPSASANSLASEYRM